MGVGNVFNTGRSAMMASKAAIATTGHNIANANTEGYSRQRVETSTIPHGTIAGSKALIGRGVAVTDITRTNDQYIEKHLRAGTRDMSNMEEKDTALRQVEDVFNEMNGEGLNRLIARFFNEFRQLSNEPDSEAVRQAVREASQAMVNDFRRLHTEVDGLRQHLDSRLEGYTREINSFAEQLKELNVQIRAVEIGGSTPNDLLDKRDQVLKQMSSYMDLTMHKDNHGNYIVDVKGVGPLVVGPQVEKFQVFRSKADDQGKPEAAFDVATSATVTGLVTHNIKGGKIGALLEVRDKTLSTIQDRLDQLAYDIADSVNQIHEMGFTRDGVQGVSFFKKPGEKARAAEFLSLSDEVASSVNNIAAAAQANAPGDNRIAIAISGLQSSRLMNGGKANFDDFYNSIVSDVGVMAARNRYGMTQQRDIMTQLNKMRDQVSGVSIDEETANLMRFQHTFDASAKVIQVADDMMKTVLELKR